MGELTEMLRLRFRRQMLEVLMENDAMDGEEPVLFGYTCEALSLYMGAVVKKTFQAQKKAFAVLHKERIKDTNDEFCGIINNNIKGILTQTRY